MDALGLLTTAAIFSEKSNIELRIIVTPAASVSGQNVYQGNFYDVSSLQGLNLSAIGIIAQYAQNIDNQGYSDVYEFSQLWSMPYETTTWKYNSYIFFIYAGNTSSSFNMVNTNNPNNRRGIVFKLTSSGDFQIAAYKWTTGSNQITIQPQTIPCILIY